jgi:hypothetical protein
VDEQDDQLIGRTATVTLAISTGHAGEVMIGIRGGTEAFTAAQGPVDAVPDRYGTRVVRDADQAEGPLLVARAA